MERLERLMDLVHVLQTTGQPLSFEELRERFEDYEGPTHEAARRKFERDKADLLRLGLVLRYLDPDEGEVGYVLDVEASYMPQTQLPAAGAALLASAARAALDEPGFPHRAALRLALAKLDLGGEGSSRVLLDRAFGDAPSERLETLQDALIRCKWVEICHRKPGAEATERRVDPYALFLRRGAWYLGGRDHRSDQIRTFRLSRIESLRVNPKAPGTRDFDRPEALDLEAMAALDPHSFELDAPFEAVIRADPEIAFMLRRRWGPEDAEGLFRVRSSNLAFLVEEVLRLGPRVELLAPPAAREAVAAALRAALEAHGALR